ncbi:hypothetical protein V1282_001434 [Nitrobacteraceae bacterium AZCC 2146]
MESLVSPILATALLTVITFNLLFVGTVIGFFCSAALVLSVTIPQPQASERKRGIYDNTTRGIRISLRRLGCVACWRSTSPLPQRVRW